MRLSVIIPVYNEEKTIEKVVRDHFRELSPIQKQFGHFEILCLDDASKDQTPHILEKLTAEIKELRVLTHSVNQGIHQSFQDLVVESKGELIYQTAADDQWPSENLARMLNKLEIEGLDYVIGVRENRNQVYSLWRQILSWGFNLIPELFFGIKTLDANSIKLGRREVFQIPLQSKSFFGEVERLILAQKRGFKIGHQSIIFLPRGSGKASGAKWKNIFETLTDFLKFQFSKRYKS